MAVRVLLSVGLAGAAAVAAAAVWRAPATPLAPRLPGMDRSATDGVVLDGPDLAGKTVRGDGETKGGAGGAWLQFRGSARTGVSDDPFELNKTLAGVKVLWSVPLGEGYAGPAISRGRVYMLDYDASARADTLRCLSLDSGKELWHHSYVVDVKRNHGMSRTVPALTEKLVITLGPKCHVVAVDAETGEFRWGKDLVREYGTKVPPWYAGQCPLVDGKGEGAEDKELLILAPAGERVLLTALDAASGSTVWETPNELRWSMTHASVSPVVVDGTRMYVYCGSGGVIGVDARDGRMLWRTTEWKVPIATVPSPVDMGEGRILLTGGYGAGAAVLQVKKNDEAWTATITKRVGPEEFGAEQHTPVFVAGHIFGARPDGQLACLTPTLETRWTGGPANKIGLGSFMVASHALFAVNDTGTLMAVELRPDQFILQGKAKVMENARECWGPLAVADGRMLVRDLTRMVCVDLRRE